MAARKVARKKVGKPARSARQSTKRRATPKRANAKPVAKPAKRAKAAVPKRRSPQPAPAKKRAAPQAKPRAAAAPKPKTAPAKPKRSPAPLAKGATRVAAVRDLERGCDAVLAAIQGLKADTAERPIAPGKWSPKQIVVHLAYWDEWMLGVLPPAIVKNRRPEPLTEARVNAANAQAVTAGSTLSWDDVRSLWATQRSLLLGLLAAVPATPAVRWSTEHALGSLLHGYADHDRHHAAQIRAARSRKVAAFAPAFAAQKSEASEKELLLFELGRARVAVKAAVKGLGAATASRPVAPGKWSPLEIVLHLVARDEARLERMAAALSGGTIEWMGQHDPAFWAAVNEAAIAPRRGLSWDDALRLLDVTRERLLDALRAVPEAPAEPWTAAHPFGALLRALVPHDRHHAEQIKAARILEESRRP